MRRLIRASSLIFIFIILFEASFISLVDAILVGEKKSESVSSSVEQDSMNNFSWNLWNPLPIDDSSSTINDSNSIVENFHSEAKFEWSSIFNVFLRSLYKQPSRGSRDGVPFKKSLKKAKAKKKPNFLFRSKRGKLNNISNEQPFQISGNNNDSELTTINEYEPLRSGD